MILQVWQKKLPLFQDIIFVLMHEEGNVFAEYRFTWNILRNDLEYLTSGSQSNSSKFYDQLEGNKSKVL